MVLKLTGVILVLFGASDLYCSGQEWKNFIDECVYRDPYLSNDIGLSAHINNNNLSVYDWNHYSLGLFTCLVFNNPGLEYKRLELKMSDEAYKRKIESNACRRYPLRSDFNETFDISNKHEVRVVTYKPVGSGFPMQSITSIKIDGVEQLEMPSQSEIQEARFVISACSAHASSQRYGNFADCQYQDIFKIFKIKIDNKLVWCYIQTAVSNKHIDFDLTNNNYKLYETYPHLDVIKNIRNNYVIVNAKNSGIYDVPRVVAVHQVNATEKPTSISFVRIDSKSICRTPLVENTINCGRPRLEVEPFVSTVYPGQYPWIVFVYTRQHGWKVNCQGTLLDQETIITGGNCVMDSSGTEKIDVEDLRILPNIYDKKVTPQENEFLAVREVIISEHYNKEYHEFDIAIIKLAKPFANFVNLTMPICTTNNVELFLDKTGIVTGFGLDRSSKPLTELSQAHIHRLRPDVCRKRDGYFRMYLNENTYCADYANNTNICTDMNGSGMYIKVNDVWMLSGVVTIGVGTGNRCSLTAISLYSDITALHGFIEANRA